MKLNQRPGPLVWFASLLWLATLTLPAKDPTVVAKGNAATVSAARNFLAILDEGQQAKAKFAFENESQRKRWSNLPTGIFERAGVRLGDLTPRQRDAAMAVLAAALSKSGYEKVIGIMEGDETLRKGGGGRLVFGKDEYYVSLLGTPSSTEPWSIQFGGHHLALNITLAGERGAISPSHTATQPAKFTLDGQIVRPLGGETDTAFTLINALNETQRKQAILGAQFRDLVLGPGQDGQTLVPEGVKVATFDEKQRTLLLNLVREWVGILHDEAAEPKMAEIQAGLGETWFAWSGPTIPGSAAYFRIQGPTLLIEYAPQRMGGDATQHIHTIYRDPTNEYGRKWWKR